MIYSLIIPNNVQNSNKLVSGDFCFILQIVWYLDKP